MLPRSLRVELYYDPAGIPHFRGGFADVWKGEYRGLGVAVKVLRIYATENPKKAIRVSRQWYSPFPCIC